MQLLKGCNRRVGGHCYRRDIGLMNNEAARQRCRDINRKLVEFISQDKKRLK